MKSAPQVLIVARYRDIEGANRIVSGLSRQTYRQTRLVFVEGHEKGATVPVESSLKICSPSGFADFLDKAEADYVLFWPDHGNLQDAAIEKLVLALALAPDQDGVADAAKGSTGLWLARNSEAMTSLIALWIESQTLWIERCLRQKPSLFFLDENLSAAPDPATLPRPYAVEHLFGKLPISFENYQPIASNSLWSFPTEETDERSVLLLVSSLPMGGACKFILDLAGQLKAQRYRVTIATTAYDSINPNPWLGELLKIVPDVFVLSHFQPVEVPRLITHLARSRRCGRIVISHSMLAYQLLPWLRSELPEVTFLDYTHIEYETEWPNGGYARRSVNNQSLLDLSLVSSEHLRQWMVTNGAEEEGLRVCHTNIDTEKWVPDAAARARDRYELGLDRKTVMILYPCRLAEQKRPELMCNIVAELRRATQVPFVVFVAGDGPLMTPLKKFIEKEDLADSLRLLGAVPLERMARLHNAADIFLLPSLIEGIALALFEAMALESVPIVADVGGQRELVTPDCGHLIPLGETARELKDYVAALKQLLENPVRRLQQASACRTRVKNHFRLSQMTSTFIAAMDEASLRRRHRPVPLPAKDICCEMATLAVDHIRVSREGAAARELAYLIQEKFVKQEKITAKLQRQIKTLRAASLVPEENELHY